MSALKKIREWLDTFPGNDRLESLQVDYVPAEPGSGSIAPSGLVEVSRNEDILGNITVENQYNFGLYYVFAKSTDDDEGSTQNADWLMDLQEWVQEQSVLGVAPRFGDEPAAERIQAQNGSIYGADEEGTAIYMVQLSVNFIKKYVKE
ncbi:MAG: hypothetical protein IKT52_08565 [Oscillospiraceae bacterium]|nr:hypothetical protein [Oscillospiraceae bacterium]